MGDEDPRDEALAAICDHIAAEADAAWSRVAAQHPGARAEFRRWENLSTFAHNEFLRAHGMLKP